MKGSEKRYQKRVEAIKAIQRSERPQVVSRVMGIPITTLYDWIARYRSGGWHALEDHSKSGRPKKVDGAVMKWLYEAITLGDPRQFQFEFCLWTRKIIRKMLISEHGIDLSLPSISRLLKQLGLSVQKPIYKAYQQNKKSVNEWITEKFPNIQNEARKEGADIYFADESSFRSDHHHGGTWGKIGTTPVVEEHRGRFGVNCISAITAKGEMFFECFTGRMNSEGFILFLKHLYEDAGKRIYLVVDGAQYHKSKMVRDFIEEMKGEIKLFILPAYSPELNPDEQIWNHAKRKTGSMCISTKTEMENIVNKVLAEIQRSTDLIVSFFKMKHTQYIIQQSEYL
ncbi:MAG: IS630 family transposase [Proteobacteria bacterium]|jgi:transposase|nr:IS630 family transposase [Pseudomonadota bacterium]